jgi:hypothetical protein
MNDAYRDALAEFDGYVLDFSRVAGKIADATGTGAKMEVERKRGGEEAYRRHLRELDEAARLARETLERLEAEIERARDLL